MLPPRFVALAFRKGRIDMMVNRKVFRLTLPADDVPAFLEQCADAAWYAFDTGERVMTDDGPDAEAVLLVEPSQRSASEARVALVH